MGDALVCARRRLRNGREGSNPDSESSCRLVSRAFWGLDPPAGFNYELFLDENGQKISKTKGNGLTIEQWLALTPARKESRLRSCSRSRLRRSGSYFDVIPRTVDDYLGFLEAYPRQSWKERLGQSGVAHSRRRAALTPKS